MGGVLTLSALGTTPVLANNHQGSPPNFPPGSNAPVDRGTHLVSRSEPLDVTSVTEQPSDPTRSNFDDEFTFWRVDFEEVTFHDRWVYREPVRLGGGENFVLDGLGGSTVDAFWYGVSVPDEDGVHHDIDHTGRVTSYYETAPDRWRSLAAQFNGRHELLRVNGVEPE